jgi:hypothetical protein
MAWRPPTAQQIHAGAVRVCEAVKGVDAQPFFIGRNGTIEVEVLFYFLTRRRGVTEAAPYPDRLLDQIQRNAGIFPATDTAIDRWCAAYLESLGLLTGTAAGWYQPTWHLENTILDRFAPAGCFRCPLRSLEPYYHPAAAQWTHLLSGKRVAVVSSFADSIRDQIWKGRLEACWKGGAADGLWSTAEPIEWTFHRTGYAPTTALGNADWPAGIKDWEEAVNTVVQRVLASGAQVALIGCGGLGMILGARLRERGVSCVVLGGAIQILFGVKGKRWATHDVISKFWNGSWVWPTAAEIPNGSHFIEGGCYWGENGA